MHGPTLMPGPVLGQKPHDDLGHLAHHMTEIMHKVLQSGFTTGAKPPDWTPAVDLCELADGYEVIVELAGVRREDIEVYAENRHLMVSGCRQDPTSDDKVRLHQMEIEQGRFRRRILLPPDADAEKTTARCRNGLLRILIPKR